MRLLIQQVKHASVCVDGREVGAIGVGVLVFLGIGKGDSDSAVKKLSEKLVHLRIFPDEAGKMNRSLLDVKGEALIVSQFTLYGDCLEGRRPSFTRSASSDEARPIYESFLKEVAKWGVGVKSGEFGAHMEVSLINNGPVTLWVESQN